MIASFLSCMPEQQAITETDLDSSSSTGGTDTSSDNSDSDSNTVQSTAKWINSGLLNESLTIDFDNSKSVYLAGDDVDT